MNEVKIKLLLINYLFFLINKTIKFIILHFFLKIIKYLNYFF